MRSHIRQDRLEFLRSIELFRACTDKELAHVDSIVDEIEVDAGEQIIREGARGQESFVIVAGEASVTSAGVEIATLGPGQFFGEMAILGSDSLRVATVTALTPMRLLVIEPRGLRMLLDISSVASAMLRGVVDRLSSVGGKPA